MNPTNLNCSVAAVVEGVLPRESGPDKALVVRVVVRADHYEYEEGSEKDHCIQRCIHYIFVRPMQYTEVWVADTPSEWEKPADEDYTLASNHDSAWRIDGMRATFTHVRAIHIAMRAAGCEVVPDLRIAAVEFIQVQSSATDRVIITG